MSPPHGGRINSAAYPENIAEIFKMFKQRVVFLNEPAKDLVTGAPAGRQELTPYGV